MYERVKGRRGGEVDTAWLDILLSLRDVTAAAAGSTGS